MKIEFRERVNRRTQEKRSVPFVLMSEREFRTLAEEYAGLCLACGEVADSGCEPDARGYKCEACDASKVYGLEECLLMNRVIIDDASDDANAVEVAS